MKVSIKTPATIANLGCGFDCFGLALPIYNIITVEETVLPGTGIEINIISNNDEINTSNLPLDKNNIAYKAIELLYNFIGQTPSEIKITIKTSIPIARGLGSSASIAVGGLMAANELLGKPADKSVLLSIATEIEGHPDNITPALFGGVTMSSWEEDGSVIYRQLPWNDNWDLTLCIPDYELATEISRSVIPKEIPIKDAVHNLRRTAMFVEALHTGDDELFKLALSDRIHQPYRAKLVPGLCEIMDNLKHIKGVLGTVLCGAGPSVLVISNNANLEEIKETVTKTWQFLNVKCDIMSVPVERNGAIKI